MTFLRCNTHNFTRKKFRFPTYITPEIRPFIRDVEMISIHLNKYNIDYVKHSYLNGTKLKILTFASKTHFHELTNTLELCRFQTKLWFWMQRDYMNELFAFQHTRSDKRKKKHAIYYSAFYKTKVKMISILAL